MARKRIYYYNRRKSRKKGKLDGKGFNWKFWPFFKSEKTPYPLLEQPVAAQFEDELLSLAVNEIDEVNELWKHKDRTLKTEYCVAKTQREFALKRFQEEEADVAPEEANVDEITRELLAHQSAPITHRTALLFHVMVFIGEVFFNAIVFNIFGFEVYESYIAASVLGIALTILAYFFGKLLKKQIRTPLEGTMLLVLPLIAIAAIAAISILRAEYLAEIMSNPDTSFGIDMSPTLAGAMFIIINIAIFCAGALISYMSFTKDETYLETLKKQYKNALKRLKNERTEAMLASNRFEATNKAYIEARNRRQKEFERYFTHAKYLKSQIEFLIEVYRTANMEVRKDGLKPLCFKIAPEQIKIPLELNPENLDWDCILI